MAGHVMTGPGPSAEETDLFTRSDLVAAVTGAAGSLYHLRDWGQAVLDAVADGANQRGRRLVDGPLFDTLTNTATCLGLPASPFEGMLEAPTSVIEVYQAHKRELAELVEVRSTVLGAVLEDLAARVIEQLQGTTWSELEAQGAVRKRPPSPPVMDVDLL